MRRGGPNVNVAIFGRAFVHLVRHPSILAWPLLAAVIDMLLTRWGGIFTDPLGGIGGGLFSFVVQIVYMFAFGVAVIQANNIARGYSGKLDDAWEEARRKAGGILLAAIGFQFVIWAAGYLGALTGSGLIQEAVMLIAAFFFIFTIPAAAIGGLPGGLALSGSIRAARANWPAALMLLIAFAVLWFFLYPYVLIGLEPYGATVALVGAAIYRALVLAYLAFPFAVLYDETAFRGLY